MKVLTVALLDAATCPQSSGSEELVPSLKTAHGMLFGLTGGLPACTDGETKPF